MDQKLHKSLDLVKTQLHTSSQEMVPQSQKNQLPKKKRKQLDNYMIINMEAFKIIGVMGSSSGQKQHSAMGTTLAFVGAFLTQVNQIKPSKCK